MEEKVLTNKKHGMLMLVILLALYAVSVFMLLKSAMSDNLAVMAICIAYIIFGLLLFAGFRTLKPQEALVLTLFGKYYGTLKGEGFYYVNPFCSAFNPAANTRLGQSGDISPKGKLGVGSGESDTTSGKRISLKIMTLNTTKAVFNVDNFKEYLSLQSDSALRNVVRLYPYDAAPNIDTTGDGMADEGSLRGSSDVVAERIKNDIQERVVEAGIEIIEARITYLAYAPEIAAVMLQRQQASAVVDARAMIVDGAVGMVKLALEKLNEDGIVELDEERKAAMVSNLMVVLCGNHDAQPIVNSGSLY